MTDEELLSVARGADSLFECLARPGGEASTSRPESREILAAWVEAFSPGDAPGLERRLGWDGLNEAAVRRALTVPAAALPAPAWTAWLDRFLAEAAALAAQLGSAGFAAEIAHLAPDPEPPFLEVWIAIVRSARRALADTGDLAGVSLSAQADFERGLLCDLAAVGEMALFERFRSFRDAAGRSGAPCYPAFVRGLLEGGLAEIFRSYPVMARHLATLAATWVDTTLELLARVRRDRDAFAATFGANAPGEICRAIPRLSDRHDGGRCVSILTFTSGLRVVYKPRDVGLERAFSDFQGWLSSRGLDSLPAPMRVLEREGYGWAQVVEREDLPDRGQVLEYFRRAGALLCVIHVLRGADAHQENVVATGRGPVLIDAEMLLQPVDRSEEMDARADGLIAGDAHGVPRSCLSPGFVTLLQVDADGVSYDVGGLMPAAPRTALVGERSWRGLRSDALHFVRERTIHPALTNQVLLDGVVQRPEWFAAEIRSGFAAAYRFFLAQRVLLLDAQGPLALFAGQRSRILFRPTDQYGFFLHALNAPQYQRSGLDRSVAMEMLNRVFRHEERRPLLWPLVAEERRALEALDVPRYSLLTREHVLETASGEAVRGHLVRSGFDAVIEGVREMNERDLERQLELLGSALEEEDAPLVARANDRGDIAAAAPLEPRAMWARAAEILGQRILLRARRAADGTLAWSESGQTPHAGFDLYRGQAGIAVFLAALSVTTGQARYSEAAAAALRPFETMLDGTGSAAPSGWPSLGACSGLGSVVYALVSAGRLLGDSCWTEVALRWGAAISRARIESDPHLDVAGGTAGALLALLALDDASAAPWVRERARDCSRRLLRTQVTTGEDSAAWPGPDGRARAGFAHGAAGIAYALARSCALTGEVELREPVRRAHHHERALFSPAVRNWPAAHEGGTALMIAWCHGAPGIGMARALALNAFADAAIEEEIHVAMETTEGAGPGRVDHLCCGDMGRSEALLTMGRALDVGHAITSAEAIATRIAERVCASGSRGVRTEGFEHRTLHPAFFRGLAGIGYQLLRTAAPSQLPSVLGFESRKAPGAR